MNLLLNEREDGFAYSAQAVEHLRALENAFQNYERLLNELAIQILTYEELHTYVKVKFVARKLKELKRQYRLKGRHC